MKTRPPALSATAGKSTEQTGGPREDPSKHGSHQRLLLLRQAARATVSSPSREPASTPTAHRSPGPTCTSTKTPLTSATDADRTRPAKPQNKGPSQMSPHLSSSTPARLPRSWPTHGRAMHAVTYLAIVGLSITVVLLATIRTATSAPTSPSVPNAAVRTAAGPRLDPRWLKDELALLATAEFGARLDHRGANVAARH